MPDPTLPSARTDFLDPRTGKLSREWYLFFLNLYTGAPSSDALLLSPAGAVTMEQVAEIQKSIQALELALPPRKEDIPPATAAPLGYLNVTDYGVNGSASDPGNMANAIADAMAKGMKLYAPQMQILMGTTTLVFPHTVQSGFTFHCDPGCVLIYSGTGDAVSIDSAGFNSYRFGIIYGSGGANAIHVNPTLPNPLFGNQTAVVGCEIEFNTIVGFQCGVYADNGTGNVAQNNFYGLVIITGQGGVVDGTMTGILYGIRASGRSHGIYQGNRWDINYIEVNPASLATGAVWIGIQDGDATMGDDNNVNTYQYGAIDGIGWPLSYGVSTFGNRNVFIGPIVDIHICVQLGSTAYYIYILAGALSTLSVAGDYEIFDGSSIAAWHWVWLGASDGRTGNLVTGTPAPLKIPFMIGSPTALPGLSAIPTQVPVANVGSSGTGLSIVAGGIQVAAAGFYTIKGGAAIDVGAPSYVQVGVAVGATVVAANTCVNLVTGVLSASADTYMNAGDIANLGAVSTAGGSVVANPANFLSVIGPL